jgi:regulator of protease activity HflC (stomatin/prohibitin superfamily)
MGQCFAIVNPDQLGALESLGTFKRILPPGFHFISPWSNVRKVSTRVQENRCMTETKTKDNVFVQIHIAVQQEVHKDNCQAAIYKLNNPSSQIDSFVSDVVRSHVPGDTLDELFLAKDSIAKEVKDRLTEKMTAYGYIIHQVLVVDIAPDTQVKNAMNQINANRRLRQAAEEKAEADKIVMVKAAEAEAESKFLQGQGVARSRAAIVQGLREAVAGNDPKALQAKDITELLLMTQYLDTLEKLSQGKSTTIFMPHSIGGLAEVAEQVRKGVSTSK